MISWNEVIVRPLARSVICAFDGCSRTACRGVHGSADVFCTKHCCKGIQLQSAPTHYGGLNDRKAAVRRAQKIVQQHKDSIVAKVGAFGTVSLQRTFDRHVIKSTAGKALVFPNKLHSKHPLAEFDCSELSPMRLGPVVHGQPNLPPARTLENFHEGSKCYPELISADGVIVPEFYNMRLMAYTNSNMQRHEEIGPDGHEEGTLETFHTMVDCEGRAAIAPYCTDKMPHDLVYLGADGTMPLFYVWVEADGSEKRMTYMQARQLYCKFYEKLAEQRPEFVKLQALLAGGIDIEICGKTAQPLPVLGDYEIAYRDEATPFAHERILAAMLTLAPANRPWNL